MVVSEAAWYARRGRRAALTAIKALSPEQLADGLADLVGDRGCRVAARALAACAAAWPAPACPAQSGRARARCPRPTRTAPGRPRTGRPCRSPRRCSRSPSPSRPASIRTCGDANGPVTRTRSASDATSIEMPLRTFGWNVKSSVSLRKSSVPLADTPSLLVSIAIERSTRATPLASGKRTTAHFDLGRRVAACGTD